MDTFVFEEGGDVGSPASPFVEEEIVEEEAVGEKTQYKFAKGSQNLWVIIASLIIAFFMWREYPRYQFLTVAVLVVTVILAQMGFSLSLLLWIPLWLWAYFR